MVFFCPDCLYSLGINKSTTLDNYEDDRKQISTINDIFKLLDKVDDFNEYKATFPKKDLLKNKKYQKLSVKDKNNLNMLFVSKIYEADLNCSNCGYKKQINSTIKLYEFNVNDKASTTRSLEDNKLLCLDPTLPRTRDFICKNSNCISHKDPSKKEAVFMKLPKSYNLTYVCNTCYYSWNLV